MQIQLKDTMLIKVCREGAPGKEWAIYVKVSEIKRALNAAAELDSDALLLTLDGKVRVYERAAQPPQP